MIQTKYSVVTQNDDLGQIYTIFDNKGNFVAKNTINEARQHAQSQNLDLVSIKGEPDVLKCMHWEKYIYKTVVSALLKELRIQWRNTESQIVFKNNISQNDIKTKFKRVFRTIKKKKASVLLVVPFREQDQDEQVKSQLLRDNLVEMLRESPEYDVDMTCAIETTDDAELCLVTPAQSSELISRLESIVYDVDLSQRYPLQAYRYTRRMNKYQDPAPEDEETDEEEGEEQEPEENSVDQLSRADAKDQNQEFDLELKDINKAKNILREDLEPALRKAGVKVSNIKYRKVKY